MIHLYRFKELNIALDVNSGAVHSVSDIVFDLLSVYNRNNFYSNNGNNFQNLYAHHPREEILEAMGEIQELTDSGLLDSPGLTEDEISPEGRGPVIKAMCLHIAHDCNMRCEYCFADAGGFSGARGLMPPDTGKRAIDFLLDQSGSRQNLEIDFFGGEPLMNFDVVKALVLYGREREKEYGKHIRFTLTTNGLLLDDEKTDFINEHMDNVILSIDGRPEVNDRMRRTISGDGTYEHIAGKLIRFVDKRKRILGNNKDACAGGSALGNGSLPDDGSAPGDENASNGEGVPGGGSLPDDGSAPKSPLYYVRGTYTAFNKDFAEDVKHLISLGFENISIEPAVTSGDEPWALTESDLPELFEEYDRLADFILDSEKAGKPLSFFHFNLDLDQGPCAYKRASGCGAGTAYIAVTPEGDIYPCHQFVGDPGFKLGNIHDGYFENRLFDTFDKAHIFSKEDCRGCWAKFYCSGGCHANAVHIEGDLMKPHRLSCALEKKRLECAIGLAAKRALA